MRLLIPSRSSAKVRAALPSAAALLLLIAFSTANAAAQTVSAIERAVKDPSRPERHVTRDPDRRPAEILALAGIMPGQMVAEIAAAGGYYTALLSRVVGDEGMVFAIDPKLIFDTFPDARQGFQSYSAEDPRSNVEYSVQRLDEFTVPAKLDSIFMVLYYHDTYWTGEDRDEMNRRFFEALRPGGTLFVLDHNAVAGSDTSVTRELHRMDQSLVVPEVGKAGFELIGEYDLLRNSDDPLTASVFDTAWRGKTDRFIYLFRKPADT